MAEITAVPLPTAVTSPLDETVATAVFDELHVDVLLTSCVVPLVNVTVAVNCAVDPTAGTSPVTATVDTGHRRDWRHPFGEGSS